nr:hypothetical protein [Tanacetum cinerariifolium]
MNTAVDDSLILNRLSSKRLSLEVGQISHRSWVMGSDSLWSSLRRSTWSDKLHSILITLLLLPLFLIPTNVILHPTLTNGKFPFEKEMNVNDSLVTENFGVILRQPDHTDDNVETTEFNRHEIDFESIEAKDKDMKLLSALESNNILAKSSSENQPPMLNKQNSIPWSSRLLRYAKSRPNGKLIYNSIINGLYVRRMIPKPGDQNHEGLMNETFHEQIDDELTEKELKQVEADDQAIQTILLSLPEDIYAAVDSRETAQEI